MRRLIRRRNFGYPQYGLNEFDGAVSHQQLTVIAKHFKFNDVAALPHRTLANNPVAKNPGLHCRFHYNDVFADQGTIYATPSEAENIGPTRLGVGQRSPSK